MRPAIAAQTATSWTSSPLGSRLRGQLTYSDGAPVANAAFLVKTADGRTLSGRTDAQGQYFLEGVTGEVQLTLVDNPAAGGSSGA